MFRSRVLVNPLLDHPLLAEKRRGVKGGRPSSPLLPASCVASPYSLEGLAKTEGLREGQSPLGLKNSKTKFFPFRLNLNLMRSVLLVLNILIHFRSSWTRMFTRGFRRYRRVFVSELRVFVSELRGLIFPRS